jgi:hypothetical protein
MWGADLMLQLIVIRFKWCGDLRLFSMDGTSNMSDELVLGVALLYAQKEVPDFPNSRDPELFAEFSIVARHNYV